MYNSMSRKACSSDIDAGRDGRRGVGVISRAHIVNSYSMAPIFAL